MLDARDFPLDRLARCVEILAQAVRDDMPDEPEVAAHLDAGAAYVLESRPSEAEDRDSQNEPRA